MINPVFSASALRRMRSFRVILLILLYALAPLAAAFSRGAVLSQDHILMEQFTQGRQLNSFLTLFVLQFFLTCLVAPAMTAGCITGERERQTMDMLLVTHTGSFRIVMGKWMEAFAFLALLIITALPMSAMALALAGMNALYSLLSTLYLMLCAFALSSLGMLCSALYRRTIASTVTSYILLFALGILFMIGAASASLSDVYAYTAVSLPPPLHWHDFINPIIGMESLTALMTGKDYSWRYACSREAYLVLHAVTLLLLSIGLSALSALLLRPRSTPRKRKKNA